MSFSIDLNRFGLSMSVDVDNLRLVTISSVVVDVVSLLDIFTERRFLGEVLHNI